MDFANSPSENAFRAELRAWLRRHVPRGPRVFSTLEAEAELLTSWQRTLHGAGWAAVHWPRQYGGRGASLTEQAIFQEELAAARAPQMMNRVGINLVGPTLIAHGSEEQRRRYLPRILSCDEIWCQLFSEPNAGSDLASLHTRADAEGDAFVVNGQKVWTSYAQFARWGILLARTDAQAPRHKGLSYLIVDMRSAGITIRPLRQITGSAEFSETFFENVLVPRENLIGAVNQGWEIAQTTLAHERGTAFPFKEQVLHRIAVDELAELVRERGGDAIARQRLASHFIEVEIMRLHNCRMMTKLGRGEMPGPESSIVKLFWADLTQHLFETALELLGPAAQLVHGDPHATAEGRWQQGFLWSRCGSIAGGTSEIQRNIIGQRLLGLPRA